MAHTPQIVPYLSYVDGKAAIEFLTAAFGFSVVQSQVDDDGALIHAELAFGTGMVLLGTADLPKGSPGTYVVVENVAEHFERAKKAGVEVVFEPEETQWGAQRYRVKDLEGHEWTFGTYQPQTEPPAWG